MTLRFQAAPSDQIPALHAILVLCGEHMYRTLGLKHWYPYMALDKFIEFSAGKDFYAVYDGDNLIGTFNRLYRN